MLPWCEDAGVNYIVGLAKNERLHALSAKLQRRAERKHRSRGSNVRLFTQFQYMFEQAVAFLLVVSVRMPTATFLRPVPEIDGRHDGLWRDCHFVVRREQCEIRL